MHGCNFKQCSAVAGETPGRCPRPRREGGSSPGPATCGWYKTYFSNCAPQQRMERRTAAPGQAGFAGPPVRKRTGKRLGIFRKTSSLVFSEIPSLFFCPGALLPTQKVPGAYCLFYPTCHIAKVGPGTDGPWFGGPGAEEVPGLLRRTGALLLSLKHQVHIVCYFKRAKSPRLGQGRTAGNRLWRMLCLR